MIRFGTGGWRAEIGVDFIKENIRLVAQGVCELMKKEGKTEKPIAIGYDRRFLSIHWKVFQCNGCVPGS